MNIECYSEESDDDDEADTAEVSVEYMDQLTPGSLHVSNHTLSRHVNIKTANHKSVKRQALTPLFIVVYKFLFMY